MLDRMDDAKTLLTGICIQNCKAETTPTLHVLVEKQVLKVLFDDDKRAVGVEYQSNPKYLANPEFLATAYTARRTVNARKLVVVSAGANATPGILERSGLGDSQVLENAGVPVLEDLPGVGNDYQDHHLLIVGVPDEPDTAGNHQRVPGRPLRH